MRSLEPHLSRNFRCHELLQSNIFLVQLILVQHGAMVEAAGGAKTGRLAAGAAGFVFHAAITAVVLHSSWHPPCLASWDILYLCTALINQFTSTCCRQIVLETNTTQCF